MNTHLEATSPRAAPIFILLRSDIVRTCRRNTGPLALLLKSMIPHHAGAIRRCEKAAIQKAEIKELCKTG